MEREVRPRTFKPTLHWLAENAMALDRDRQCHAPDRRLRLAGLNLSQPTRFDRAGHYVRRDPTKLLCHVIACDLYRARLLCRDGTLIDPYRRQAPRGSHALTPSCSRGAADHAGYRAVAGATAQNN